MHLIWTILIGFVVMTLLGIGGSLAATYHFQSRAPAGPVPGR
jgi:hypothetical protein